MYIPVGVLIDSLSKRINLPINVFFVRWEPVDLRGLSTITIYGARREWNCETVDILLSLLRGLSTITIYGATRRDWNCEDVDSCRFLSRDLSTFTVYGAGEAGVT